MSVRDTTLLLHELGLARQREWQLIVACSRSRSGYLASGEHTQSP